MTKGELAVKAARLTPLLWKQAPTAPVYAIARGIVRTSIERTFFEFTVWELNDGRRVLEGASGAPEFERPQE